MTILLIFVGVTVLLLILLNVRRWSGLARGAKDARRGLEEELHGHDDD
jgi:hypothetical protein